MAVTHCASLVDYCLAFYCVCICCRPSTVKSCNIFAKIFIHQPGLRHCRVNEQQLLAHSKWILPARYPTWAFLLFFLSYLRLLLPQCRWCRMRALPPALNSLSGNGLFCFTVKTSRRFPGRGRKIVSLIVSGENIIWERKACYWMHYHIHDRSSGGKATLIKAVQEAYS